MQKQIAKILVHTKKILALLRRRWKLSAVLAVVLLAGVFFFLRSKSQEAPALNFAQPVRQDLTKTLDVSGVVDAKEKVQMRFLTGGRIVYVGAKVGDWVDRHQVIARTDASLVANQRDQALNNYLIERWTFENSQEQVKDKDLTDIERREVEQEQFRLNNSVLAVEMQQIGFRDNYISAPFAGVLTVAPTPVAGVQLGPTDFFELVNPASLIFRAAVDEADIASVQSGQKAVIELDAYRDTTFNSSVDFISYTSNSTNTGTVFIVEMPLPNPDINTYRIGMNGDVKIELAAKQNALTIPLNATRERDNKFFVDVKTGENSFEEREITVGLETEDTVEVLSGLTEDDWVLIPE
jgi:macrolide-specific efflux system membrane fusion protein